MLGRRSIALHRAQCMRGTSSKWRLGFVLFLYDRPSVGCVVKSKAVDCNLDYNYFYSILMLYVFKVMYTLSGGWLCHD